MKQVLFLFFAFMQLNLLAQGGSAYSIKKITTQEKVFTGQINNKYDITIYLKYYSSSGEHQYIYSVKGYYYYNRIKTPIPIVGIYDGDLTLYVMDDAKKRDEILNFYAEGFSFWDQITKLKNMDGYREKFAIQEGESQWLSGDKVYSVTLNEGDLSVYNESEYLEVQNADEDYHIALRDIGLYEENFTLVKYKTVNNETRVLLKFDFISNPNYNGRCGAGSEVGFIILTFDRRGELKDINRVLIESCMMGIYSEYIPSANPRKVMIYAITDEEGKIINKKLDLENIAWMN